MTSSKLHVEGRNIKDSVGRTVFLRGINKHGFEDSPTSQWITPNGSVEWATFNPDTVAANLDAMKSWGINIVRCYANAIYWINDEGGHRSIIKQLAQLLADRDMYLIYTFWRCVPGESQVHIPFPSTTFPDAASFVAFWASIANELKNYPNILFAWWNEPLGKDRVAEWFTTIQQCIDAVRVTGAENLLITEWEGIWFNLAYGTDEGYPIPTDAPVSQGDTMWWVQGNPLADPLGNLVYEFHSYRTGGTHDYIDGVRYDVYEREKLEKNLRYCLVDHVQNVLNKPVICGEIGPNMGQTGEELQRELEFYQNSLQLFNERGIHYLGFLWWVGMMNAHLIDGPNYQPNAAGVTLINALSEAPPPPCFVATACYGSPLSCELNVLRRFRNRCLPRLVVHGYYKVGAYLAQLIKRRKAIKRYVREVLNLFVKLYKGAME